MLNNKLTLDINNNTLTIELNKYGRQADGSVLIRYGDTVMFVSACSKKEQKEAKPFLPLIVDYRQYTYAGGKIPGGFFKREGRPSEKEILISRLIDRPIRSLFPEGYSFDTQIVALLLSADLENEPDTLGVIGASAALYFSDIPFTTPLGAVKVGYINNEFIINPPQSLLEKSPLNMTVIGTEKGIVVIEAASLEIEEDKIIEGVTYAQETINKIIKLQKDLYEQLNIKKREYSIQELSQETFNKIEQKISTPLTDAFKADCQKERTKKLREIQKSILENIPEDNEDEIKEINEIFYQVQKKLIRNLILNKGERPDGRSFDEIRPITIETGILPRTHGSAVFTRGETQCLATVTLGTFEDTQTIDGLGEKTEKQFMLHYNFPPFSVGEVSFLRGPGRREIGHGALAEKAIITSIPIDEGEFPYTIRIVSDILESNGSSSMATVCGSVMALMDAGVPISTTVAGMAMGLITEGDRHIILTDIAGMEDHFGDMDLKVAGSEKGITAIQMDLKVPSIPIEVFKEGLLKARDARLKVLDKMKAELSGPRPEISKYAPRIISIYVKPSKVGLVIGPSGKTIKSIIAETNAKIDIEESGKVNIASPDMEAVKRAEQMIKDLTAEPEVGITYSGKVVRIEDYGAFVKIMPNADGLLHISEIANYRVRNVRDEIKMGQTLDVKVISIDENNKVRLSKKALDSGSPSSSNTQNKFKKNNYSSRPNPKKNRF
jgi:polyribonucleotide nucleotidyltransferase